jgi:hypothetical protein
MRLHMLLQRCHTLICLTWPCDCLHSPPGVVHLPHLSSGYLYLCFQFVCCQFVLFVKSNSVLSQLLLFPSLSFFCPCCHNKQWYFNTVCIWVLPEMLYLQCFWC